MLNVKIHLYVFISLHNAISIDYDTLPLMSVRFIANKTASAIGEKFINTCTKQHRHAYNIKVSTPINKFILKINLVLSPY